MTSRAAERTGRSLSSPAVDLVIVLQTQDSWGVATEIGAFSIVPEITFKTAILMPGEHYTPDSGFLSNTVDLYPVKDGTQGRILRNAVSWRTVGN